MKKRVTIYERDLRQYIDIVSEQLEGHTAKVKAFADQLDPPYPLISLEEAQNTHQMGALGRVVYSCMYKMYNDLTSISDKMFNRMVDEYSTLPSRNSGLYGNNQKGITDSYLSDETLAMSDAIAEYIVNHDIKVPYIRRGTITSDKITTALAIIYTGRQLMKRKEDSMSAN